MQIISFYKGGGVNQVATCYQVLDDKYWGPLYHNSYVIVPEKRDLNEANMKIEIYPFSSSSQ